MLVRALMNNHAPQKTMNVIIYPCPSKRGNVCRRKSWLSCVQVIARHRIGAGSLPEHKLGYRQSFSIKTCMFTISSTIFLCGISSQWALLSGLTFKYHGPYVWYVKLLVAHAPGIPGTFSPPSILCIRQEAHESTTNSQIPQCTCPIYHIATFIYKRSVHISILKGALWDLERVNFGICEIGLLFH